MKMSVFLSNDVINVVIGRVGRIPLIADCKRYTLPQESMINNIIIDNAAFTEVLAQIKKDYSRYSRNVRIVLGGNQAIVKSIEVPYFNESKLLEITKRELSSFKEFREDMIFDYSVIKKNNNGGRILCTGIRRDFIENYINLFKENGFRIKTINLAYNAGNQLCSNIKSLEGRTYIFAVLDGKTLKSNLFIEGELVYNSNTRLISARSTDALHDEVLSYMTNIMNFAKNNYKDVSTIEMLLLGGMQVECEAALMQKLNEALPFTCSVISDDKQFKIKKGLEYRVSDYVYATGNLFGR